MLEKLCEVVRQTVRTVLRREEGVREGWRIGSMEEEEDGEERGRWMR